MARISYPAPALVRAAEVANALSVPGVIKGQVDQVEIRVEGVAEQDEGGKSFRIPATGQSWRVSEEVQPLPLGRPVIVEAALQDWKGPGPATLRILGVETP